MIEPLDSLAFSMQGAKGVYALLLGSGISRSAGIPTAWEITLDLVGKIAELRKDDCGPDREVWFRQHFGKDPSYDNVVDALGKTQAERRVILQGYIEPNEVERERGAKLPTAAHHAIAGLAKSGFVRVILTTNFDRLLEQALSAVGVAYTVIASPDSLKGAVPLTHSPCTLIKLHGDYLDTRIKNTPAELEKYDDSVDSLLGRVFDEYGLVICGWSGDYDTALRAAIERCPNRRYSTYWAAMAEPASRAASLIRQRCAQVISITGADSFFAALADKVASLEEYNRPHPLSVTTAVETLKLYLSDKVHRIRLGNLVLAESDKLANRVRAVHSFRGQQPTLELICRLARQMETAGETVMALLAAGCYWGEPEHDSLWVESLSRIAGAAEAEPVSQVWPILDGLLLYPFAQVVFAAGLAAVVRGRFDLLNSVLSVPLPYRTREFRPAMCALELHNILSPRIACSLIGNDNHRIPVSERLHGLLRPIFRVYLPNDRAFDRAFDELEYLRSCLFVDANGHGLEAGRFLGHVFRDEENSAVLRLIKAAEKQGNNWPPLLSGLFGGDVNRFNKAKVSVQRLINDVRWT